VILFPARRRWHQNKACAPAGYLDITAPDSPVWRTCQERGIVLITGNRNAEGPESLESTIRDHNTPDSLPVLTIANVDRLHASREYALRVAERLLEYLDDLGNIRGAGRIYLP